MKILKVVFPLILFLLVGCGAGSAGGSSGNADLAQSPDVPPVVEGDWYRPPVLVTWQWQLRGRANVGYSVEIYDIDLFDSPEPTIGALQAAGKKVICYFSAGSYEEWRADAGEFVKGDLGNALEDWPGERWLDIRSPDVQRIMRDRIDLAKQKGCDGIEPDNTDGYANDTGFDLSASDQLAYNRFIANEAHLRGLSVGLKNDLEQVKQLADYYDFSVNEQCHEFDECTLLQPFISSGKPVLNAEYGEEYVEKEDALRALCATSKNKQFSTLILPLELDDSFRISCQ